MVIQQVPTTFGGCSKIPRRTADRLPSRALTTLLPTLIPKLVLLSEQKVDNPIRARRGRAEGGRLAKRRLLPPYCTIGVILEKAEHRSLSLKNIPDYHRHSAGY